jgi:hypothetical protein
LKLFYKRLLIGFVPIVLAFLNFSCEKETNEEYTGNTGYIDHQKPELLTSAVILLLSFNLYYVKSCILNIY